MANYKQEQASGEVTKWKRTQTIVINNPVNKFPDVLFHEETATQLPDGSVFTQPDGAVSMIMSDFAASVQIIDMQTGLPKGQTITFKEIYDIVASLYLDLAIKRDTPPVVEPESTHEEPMTPVEEPAL